MFKTTAISLAAPDAPLLTAAAFHGQGSYSASLDHLVGAGEERRRYREAQCAGYRKIDHKFDFGGLKDRQVRRLGSFESAMKSGAYAPSRPTVQSGRSTEIIVRIEYVFPTLR
jgi:hypothetical protein